MARDGGVAPFPNTEVQISFTAAAGTRTCPLVPAANGEYEYEQEYKYE
jgi:2-methylaconitate cis-trans-isomerase PrpF